MLTKSKELTGLIATITSKGQVTIPASVRAAIGLVPGDQIEFVRESGNKYVITPRTCSIKELKGIVPKLTKPVNLKNMEEAIAKGALRD